MRPSLAGWLIAASTLGVSLLALAGCAASPATRFYVLAPVAASAAEPTSLSPVGEGVTIGVRAVDLPEELDRPQIVTRPGPNTVRLAEFDRWSAPLRDSVVQVLAEDLAALLPAERIARYPWTPGTRVDREVIVEVARFDGELQGACALDARWRIVTRAAAPSAISGRSRLREACGADYAALVAAQSRLLGALAAEIATAIRTGALTAGPATGGIPTRPK